jgi:hypothetical protein
MLDSKEAKRCVVGELRNSGCCVCCHFVAQPNCALAMATYIPGARGLVLVQSLIFKSEPPCLIAMLGCPVKVEPKN